MTWGGWLLLVWSALGLVWWIAVMLLVRAPRRSRSGDPRDRSHVPMGDEHITVFKALAGNLDTRERAWLEHCLETFVAALDPASELLVGVHRTDEAGWRTWARRMAERYPGAAVTLVVEADPGRLAANPKVSWMRLMALRARGGLWYWSDADMEAPPDLLAALRRDFAAADRHGMVTSPYVVRHVSRSAGMLDALYVNLEHHPGTLLLERLGRVRFGFGAGMLFEASDLHQRVDWDQLGECLADDFHLGQRLAPVHLGATRLTTAPASGHWRGALLHYHRWHKTVRWVAPAGFAAQVLVLPALGWLAAVLLAPQAPWAWLGLLGIVAMDTAAGWTICRRLGCHIEPGHWYALPAWSLIRPLTWLVCWLPIPIFWRGTAWRSPHQRRDPSAPLPAGPPQGDQR